MTERLEAELANFKNNYEDEARRIDAALTDLKSRFKHLDSGLFLSIHENDENMVKALREQIQLINEDLKDMRTLLSAFHERQQMMMEQMMEMGCNV